jgi:hypothetical protein
MIVIIFQNFNGNLKAINRPSKKDCVENYEGTFDHPDTRLRYSFTILEVILWVFQKKSYRSAYHEEES